MVSNDTKLIPKYTWQEQKIHNLPEILDSCTAAQREIFCKSVGLMDEIPPETGINLHAADNFSDRGPETRLQKKMKLLKQQQEELNSETYAKELTSKQYDKIMNPMKDSTLKEAQDMDPFCQNVKWSMKDGKSKSE